MKFKPCSFKASFMAGLHMHSYFFFWRRIDVATLKNNYNVEHTEKNPIKSSSNCLAESELLLAEHGGEQQLLYRQSWKKPTSGKAASLL